MRTARIVLAATACVVTGVLFGPSLASAVDKAKSVLVANTDSQPVPTKAIGTASVDVANTPSVKVEGTPSVSLAGTPVHGDFRFTFGNTSVAISDPPGYRVPAGKRLRIDFVSFHDSNSIAGVGRLDLRVSPHTAHFIATSAGSAGGDVASQPITAYVEAGELLDFSIELDRRVGLDENNLVLMFGHFTGVLLDA